MKNKSNLSAIFVITILSVAMLNAIPNQLVFADSISLSSYKSEIKSNESILIMGNIQTGTFFKPVELVMYDQNGKIIYNPYVAFSNDGSFKKLFHPPLGGFESGTYTIKAIHEKVSEPTILEFTVIGNESDLAEFEDIEAEIIPEFGVLSVVVLSIAIMAVVIISSKSSTFKHL